jgi:hypothetical protein
MHRSLGLCIARHVGAKAAVQRKKLSPIIFHAFNTLCSTQFAWTLNGSPLSMMHLMSAFHRA